MTKIEKAYARLGKLVFKTAWKFSKKYRRDPEEEIANANAIFVDAFKRFNPKRQTLESWLVYKITMELTGILRNELRREKLLSRIEADFEGMEDVEIRTFDMVEFLEELGADAQQVVRLVFDTPKHVEKYIKRLGGPTPRNMRRALRRELKKSGWGENRISRTFNQIGKAIA